VTGVQRGWRQASWSGLAIVLVLLARWAVLAPILGTDPADPAGQALAVGVDYLSAATIALGVVAALIGIATTVRGRCEQRGTRWARWASRPLVLAFAVLAAAFAVPVLGSLALAPVVAGSRAAAAFVDRLTFVTVVVETLAVFGVGLAGLVAALSGRQRRA